MARLGDLGRRLASSCARVASLAVRGRESMRTTYWGPVVPLVACQCADVALKVADGDELDERE